MSSFIVKDIKESISDIDNSNSNSSSSSNSNSNDNETQKVVLVTGAAGFIGSHVSDALMSRGNYYYYYYYYY